MPGTVDAAARELELIAFTADALRHLDSRLSGAQRRLLTNLHRAHQAHATALLQRNPFDSPASSPPASSGPTPSPSASATPAAVGKSPKKALAKLRSLETAAARTYTALAVRPTGPQDQLGDLVLLWGSLAAASTSYAAACQSDDDLGPSVTGDQRETVSRPTPTKVAQTLLTQCYAIIFGYQAALAKLTGHRDDHARSTLADYRELRDQLVALITEQRATLPEPHPAYKLPVQPTSTSRAVRLVGLMQTRMLPYLGQWLATASDHDRHTALRTMINTAEDTLSWSPTIIVWPGYPVS